MSMPSRGEMDLPCISNAEDSHLDPARARSCHRRRTCGFFKSRGSKKRVALCCFCFFAFVALLLPCLAGFLFVADLGNNGPLWTRTGQLLTPQNLSAHIYWPSCHRQDLLPQLAAFNAQYEAHLIRFSSRPAPNNQETLELSAWWLPPPGASTLVGGVPAPRIIVTHGYGGNFNDWSVQLAAYFLRSLGYGVIAPNLRNHGFSAKTRTRYCTWGWALPYDVLGAWDYAVQDPSGKLGGSLPPSKVGLLGFSMGGFLTSIAFGLEPDVPAAWIDSGPFDLRQVLLKQLQLYLGPAGQLFISPSWWFASWLAGVSDLQFNSPSKALPSGPASRRPVALVQNLWDRMVTKDQTQNTESLLRGLPTKYTVAETFYRSTKCHGETHLLCELVFSAEYVIALSNFWSQAFNISLL